MAEFGLKVWQSHIPLSLSCFLGYPLPIGLTRADPGKSGRTIATPPKSGGSCGPDRGEVLHASTRPLGGRSRPVYPCGKAHKSPQRRRSCAGEPYDEMAVMG